MIRHSLLKFLPKNYLSLLIGKLAKLESPRFLIQLAINYFIKCYKINLEEIEKPPSDYTCLNEFFTRNLACGAREISAGLVSPVDGKITQFGQIKNTTLIQAKGIDYTLDELLIDPELAKHFKDGFFITIYLAPYNYHHIHTPIDGEIVESIHVPGKLWNVDAWSIENIKKLFVVNERVISVLKSQETGYIAVVKVGATGVGSISVEFDDVKSNVGAFNYFKKPIIKHYDQQLLFKKGQKLGTFNLGSTVILLMQKQFYPKYNLQSGEVRLGDRLGDYS
ncbi:MAG: archaetidylserine decarboxylase [Deltaproteobacteria bacterium]|jgi:phosphatidylserine decarboxylase|nr:archaetidylserine decarboxylase [Deltaproteobacteria bacterium]